MGSDTTPGENRLEDTLEDHTSPRRRLLYPIFGSHNERTFEIALDLAEGSQAKLFVLDLVDDPDTAVDESRSIGAKLLETHLDPDHDVDVTVLLEDNSTPVSTIKTVAQTHEVDLLLVDEHSPSSLTDRFRGDVSDRVATQVPCDSVSVSQQRGKKRISSILVSLAEGRHSGLASTVAGALGLGADAVVELFHVSDTLDASAEARAGRLFQAAREQLPDEVTVETWHVAGDDVASAIAEQSRHYDVTVLGNPTSSRLRQFVSGSIPEEVSDSSENTVLTVRKNDDPGFQL